MKHRIIIICSAILAVTAVHATAQELPAEDFNAFVNSLRQFDAQWAGPSRKAGEQIEAFLKKENLSLDQQGRLLTAWYPYAQRLGDKEAETVWSRIVALPDAPARKTAMLKTIGAMPFGTAEQTARAYQSLCVEDRHVRPSRDHRNQGGRD